MIYKIVQHMSLINDLGKRMRILKRLIVKKYGC